MNPFKYGQVVSKSDFCPRPKLEKALTQYVLSGQNVVLQGERRCGKTSLIYEIARRMKKVHFIQIDLLGIKSVDDLCKRIIRAMVAMEQKGGTLNKILGALAQMRPSLTFDPITGATTVSLTAMPKIKPESIEGLMDLMKSIGDRKKLAVAFDEFQDILNLKEAPQVLALLRSRIQFHSGLSYLYAGSVRNQMQAIFTDDKSPFFKSAASLDVGPLARKDFTAFLAAQFKKGNRKVSQETYEKILNISHDTPGDVQQICSAIWDVTDKGASIDNGIIPAAMALIFSRELKGYESILNQVSNQQLRCLKGLAKLGGKSPFSSEYLQETGISQPGSVKKALNRLMDVRIVYLHNREYRFANAFFKHWLIFKDL